MSPAWLEECERLLNDQSKVAGKGARTRAMALLHLHDLPVRGHTRTMFERLLSHYKSRCRHIAPHEYVDTTTALKLWKEKCAKEKAAKAADKKASALSASALSTGDVDMPAADVQAITPADIQDDSDNESDAPVKDPAQRFNIDRMTEFNNSSPKESQFAPDFLTFIVSMAYQVSVHGRDKDSAIKAYDAFVADWIRVQSENSPALADSSASASAGASSSTAIESASATSALFPSLEVKAKFTTPSMLSPAAMDRFNVRFICKTDKDRFEYAEL